MTTNERGEMGVTCSRAGEIDVAAFALERAAPDWAEFRAHYPLCRDCAREVARFAQLAALLEREAPSAGLHPAEAELLAFAEAPRALAAAARERVQRHLAGCAACRSELAVLQRFDLASLAPEANAASFGERVRSALGGLASALRPPLRTPAFAFAGAAAIALMLGAWFLRAPTRDAQSEPPPALAAKPELREQPVAVREEPAPAVAEATPEVVAEPQPEREIARTLPRPEPAPDLTPEPAPGVEARELAPPPPAAEGIAALIPAEAPRYAPREAADRSFLRIAGTGRGAGDGAPRPLVLAPQHEGITARESPTLYWYLPAATPLSVAVSIVSDATPAPLLEATLPGPVEAGVHELSLAERGVRLVPGVANRWFVAVVPDPERRSRDLVSSAGIRYAPPDAELASRLADARERLAHVYAEAGLWYDAFDQLSRWAANEPDAPMLRSHRAALLEQVGLPDVAANLSAAPPSGRAP